MRVLGVRERRNAFSHDESVFFSHLREKCVSLYDYIPYKQKRSNGQNDLNPREINEELSLVLLLKKIAVRKMGNNFDLHFACNDMNHKI